MSHTCPLALAQGDSSGIATWDFAYRNGRCDLTCDKNSFAERRLASTNPCAIRDQLRREGRKIKLRRTESEPKRYLLSFPTQACSYYHVTASTIGTMLMTPQTELTLLVQQSEICATKVCALRSLPRAWGSSIKVLPVPPSVLMESSPDDGCSTHVERQAIREVAKKIWKIAKVNRFDGYMAFEEERLNWVFLERVGKEVELLAEKR